MAVLTRGTPYIMEHSMYRPTPHFAAFVAGTLLLLVGLAANAYDANVSWVNATQNTDGTAIPASGDGSLRDTSIRFGSCNVDKTAIATVRDKITVPASQLSLVITGLPAGTYCFQAQHSSVDAVLGATSGDGVSAWTAVVAKTYTAPKPAKPSGLVVQ